MYKLGCTAVFSILNVSSTKTGAMHDSVLGPLRLTQCLAYKGDADGLQYDREVSSKFYIFSANDSKVESFSKTPISKRKKKFFIKGRTE